MSSVVKSTAQSCPTASEARRGTAVYADALAGAVLRVGGSANDCDFEMEVAGGTFDLAFEACDGEFRFEDVTTDEVGIGTRTAGTEC